MIYGIGTDIVSLKRIIRLSKKFGQAFAERILTPEELLEFPKAGKPVNYLAKRFAAKEAFAKAVGTGIRGAVSFRYRDGSQHNLYYDLYDRLEKAEVFRRNESARAPPHTNRSSGSERGECPFAAHADTVASRRDKTKKSCRRWCIASCNR